MAVKYQIDYYDTENILHEITIDDPDFVGSVTEVEGRCWLQYSQSEDVMECIRGRGLRLELEANQNLKFEELGKAKAKTIVVTYSRAGSVLFKGYLESKGWYEDYVRAEWKITFDCVDGLGYLENLSFVEDATGLNFIGRKSMLETLQLALKRSGFDRNINIDIGIFYDGLAETEEILTNCQVNMARYIEEDDDTIMSCDKVIRDILEPFTACVVSKGDEWYIYRPLRLADKNGLIDFFRYDSTGTPLAPAQVQENLNITLGSWNDGFYPHHANADQRLNRNNPISAYRINYKYGQLTSIVPNPYMDYDSGSGTIPFWNPSGSIYISYPLGNGAGVSLTLRDYADPRQVELESDPITVGTGLELDLKIVGLINRYPTPGYDATLSWQVVLEDDGSADEWFLRLDGTWEVNTNRINEYTNNSNVSFVIEVASNAPTPVSGDIKLRLYTARGTLSLPGGGTGGGSIDVTEYSLANVGQDSEGATIEGEFHTFTRDDAPSTEVKDVKEVYTGDNEEDNFEGSIYKADGTTNTTIWNREGKTDEVAILGIMGIETMRASQEHAQVYEGSVYGFFEYLSLITINGLNGNFVVTDFNYDTLGNVIELTLTEIFTGELVDLTYEITFDRGNVVKPTIKG